MNHLKFLALFLLSLCLVVSSCKKDDDPDDPDNLPTNYFFIADVDGTNLRLVDGEGDLNASCSYGSTHGDSCTVSYMPAVSPFNPDEGEHYYFSFQNYFHSEFCSDEEDVFNSLFPVGPIDYAQNSNEKNIVVGLYTSTEDWSTLEGSQAGSKFEITSTKPIIDPFFGVKAMEIRGTFSCKLYDGTGGVKVIENGQFYMFVRVTV